MPTLAENLLNGLKERKMLENKPSKEAITRQINKQFIESCGTCCKPGDKATEEKKSYAGKFLAKMKNKCCDDTNVAKGKKPVQESNTREANSNFLRGVPKFNEDGFEGSNPKNVERKGSAFGVVSTRPFKLPFKSQK